MGLEERSGRYRVLDRIAAGGMGEVYRATIDTIDGVHKPVALKVIRAALHGDPDLERMFVEEAKVAISLSHANIVQAFDVGKIDDQWFIAMEYVEGVDLATLLRACQRTLGQPMPHRHVLFVGVEALKGLDYAHRKKTTDGRALEIVHRDVSPGNILLSNEGEVKIVDFGIAKSAMNRAGPTEETVKGKIPYMAPEQLRGGAVDRRADIYSVGAVLYEMLTCARVVPDSDSSAAAIMRVLKGDFPAPRALEARIPGDIEHAVLRALKIDPEERYPSAAAMRQEFERLAMQYGYLLSSNDLADFASRADPILSALEFGPETRA